MYRYFKKLVILVIFQHGNLKNCLMKVLSLLTTSNNSLASALSYTSVEIRVKFAGSCLKQDKLHLLIEI